MKLSVKLHIIAMKPKYKTKYYYTKCATQKILETKHETLNTKNYFFCGSKETWSESNTCIAQPNLKVFHFNYLFC